MKLINILYFLFVSVVLFSCSNAGNDGTQNASMDTIKKIVNESNDSIKLVTNDMTVQEIDSATTLSNKVYLKYELPLPVEIFRTLKSKEIEFRKENLASLELYKRAGTSISKAFVMGYYISDLAYSVTFDRPQQTYDYFLAAKKASDDLEIGKGYDKYFIERVDKNLENLDSLRIIADEAYLVTCNHLDENSNVNVLPFVVTAAWLESVNILLLSQKEKENNISGLIANEKKSLDLLLNFLNDMTLNSNVLSVSIDLQNLINTLKELKVIFDAVEENTTTDVTKKQSKELLLKIKAIKEQYSK